AGRRRTVSDGARRVAMVIYGDVSYDSRVQKQASSLVQAGHAVTIFCLDGSPDSMRMVDARVEVRRVPVRGRRGLPHSPSPFLQSTGRLARPVARARWLGVYVRNLVAWGGAVRRLASDYDTWHVHDFTGLVAAWIARPARVALVYDVHDLFLET